MLTVVSLKAHGFNVSQQLDQSKVDRAEEEIKANYFTPLFSGAIDYTVEPYYTALASLVFLLLVKRNVIVTRTGTEKKANEFANSVYESELSEAIQSAAASYKSVRALRTIADGRPTDICGIYFKTNFIHI